MLLIACPYCEEELPELEFRHAGQAHIERSGEITTVSDDDFEGYFFIRSNPKGIVFERWRHVHGCGRFFNAARDTVTDKFLKVYRAGEPKPDFGLADNENRRIDDGRGDKPADAGPGAWVNLPPDRLNVDMPKKGEA